MKEENVVVELPVGWQAAIGEAADESGTDTSAEADRIARLAFAVGGLNAVASSLPKEYGWRFMTADSFSARFEAKASAGSSVGELNRFYWRDALATVEAYMVMSVWRMVDIVQAAFRCMDDEGVVPCAILARSALESAVQFVQDARTIGSTLDQVAEQDLTSGVCVSEELERYLVQTVFASRRTGAEEIYKSKNILTVLDKIAKVAKDDPIKEKYEILCEVTHPNFLGRSTYLVRSEDDRGDGSELRVISPRNGVNAASLLRSALWALSWAIEAQVASTHLLQGAVARIVGRLPSGSDD